ncbi:hypothetical protein CRYUN_Cryun05aG0015800 [Craigia yunnanensis]
MAEQQLDSTASPGLHLPRHGNHRDFDLVGKGNDSFLKKFVKKLITEVESNHGNLLDELYEQYASYMTSFKVDSVSSQKQAGSGVDLIGICLAHVKASKVMLSDGKLLTLANMKLNLEINQLNTETDLPETSIENQNVSCDKNQEGNSRNSLPELTYADIKVNGASQRQVLNAHDLDSSSSYAYNIKTSGVKRIINDAANLASRADPVAYIASIIWNADIFNHFLALADQSDLTITDLTSSLRPFDLLP